MSKFSEFDKVAKEHGQGGDRSGFFRPDVGESKVRILSSEFEVLPKHWLAASKRSVVCYGKDKGCPHDIKAKDKKTGEEITVHKPGIKYLVWLIDRADNQIKIGELPYTVIKALVDLRSSEEYGFEELPPYDIIIKKSKTGTASTDVEYSVIPSRKDSPITDEESAEFNDKTPLSELVQRMKEKEMLKEPEAGLVEEEKVDE